MTLAALASACPTHTACMQQIALLPITKQGCALVQGGLYNYVAHARGAEPTRVSATLASATLACTL